jgi:hypothetical protein
MQTSRWNVLAGCAGRIVITTMAAWAGTTLFGFGCGLFHATLKANAGLVSAWTVRFSLAGLIGGLLAGACAAYDYASNPATCGDAYNGQESPADGSGRSVERPITPPRGYELTHAAHEGNGRR